jgi:hypothetical protein
VQVLQIGGWFGIAGGNLAAKKNEEFGILQLQLYLQFD